MTIQLHSPRIRPAGIATHVTSSERTFTGCMLSTCSDDTLARDVSNLILSVSFWRKRTECTGTGAGNQTHSVTTSGI